MKFPKPEPRAFFKKRQHVTRAKERQQCIAAVWKRSGNKCERCKARVSRSGPVWERGHVHEKRARSLGGNPYDPAACQLVCVSCHHDGPSGAHTKSEARHV